MPSLRTALILLILGTALPGVALSLKAAVDARAAALASAENSARGLLQAAAEEQRALIAGTRRLLTRLASLPDLWTPFDAGFCERALRHHLDLYPHLSNLGVADVNGDVICSPVPLSRQVNIADRSYFVRASATGDFAAGEYQVGRITGEPTIVFGLPASQAEPPAVLFAALGLDWLNLLVSRAGLPEGAQVVVTDAHDTVLAHHPHPQNWVGRRSPIADRALEGGPALVLSSTLHQTPSGPVRMSVAVPENSLYGALNVQFLRTLWLLLVVTGIAIFTGVIGGQMLVLRRVNALVGAADELAAGRLAARSRLPHSEDEFGRLARSFDAMAAELEARQGRLERANRALRTLSASNRTLLRAQDEAALLTNMCRDVVTAGGYAAAWVGCWEAGAATRLVPVAATAVEPPQLTLALADAQTAPVLQRAGAVLGCCPELGPHLTQAGYAAALILPLRVAGRGLGALFVYSREADAFDPAEQRLLGEAAQDLAFGIEVIRQREQHQRAEETVQRLARYERLTGLPNRVHFQESLQHAVSAAARERDRLAVLLLDINRFREINTAFGYAHGDEVLREIGQRLRGITQGRHSLAHLGEDEFAVLGCGLDREAAGVLAAQLTAALRGPVRLPDVSLDVGASIGVALYPHDGVDAESLIRRADAAMYQSKRMGRDFEFYSAEQDRATPHRLALAADLRHAVENADLRVLCQPKLDLRSGLIQGAEALARWPHPDKGEISPVEFIALAEHTGLIKPLTEWVLNESLRHARRWYAQGLRLSLAVNVSARNLQERDFVAKVQTALARAGVPPACLALELTESALMEDPEGALEVMSGLHRMGVRLYIDDFGTGYSSLAYLQRLPVQAVKIDKSFVQDMLVDKDSARIVQSTIELAHGLDMEVVAEGVENDAILDALRRFGCDIVQGYGIARPLPPEALVEWAASSPWRLADAEQACPRRRER